MPVKALVPETSVSTNSTTGAKAHCNEHIIDKKRLLSIAFFWYTSTNMSVYPSDKLFKLLRGIIIVLIAAIIIGTVIAVVKKTKERASGRQDEESDAGAVYIPPKEYALYGDLGQLRAVTADNPPITVVIKPFLEYKASDTAFQEELVTKKEALKKSILDWFSLESAYRLSSELPQDIKQTLMERINKQLVLGKIHNIYFEEFVILY